MPHPLPLKNRLRATVSLLALLMLVFTTSIAASAQRGRKRPVTDRAAQQQSNANTATAQQKPPRKNITPLRSGDTADGSRITITSDAPLNDYSAYRSGDRYYVVIPEANAPRAQAGMRGKGFEDVQVQKRGNDAILSFKLQPGTNARVSQRFNRLDVELTAPGGGTRVPAVTPTPTQTPAVATQPTPRPTPQTQTGTQVVPGTGQVRPPGQNNANTANPTLTPQPNGTNPTVVYAPSPEAGASPGASPQAGAQSSPAATPPSGEVAQNVQPPAPQPATNNSSASSGTTLGTILQRNWLFILIGALVLLGLVLFVATRSRAERTATAPPPPALKPERKEKRAEGAKAVAKLKEADASSAVTAASSAPAVASSKPDVGIEEVAASVAAVEAVKAVEDEKAVEVVEEKPATVAEAVEAAPAEKEIVPAVDVTRVEGEVKNVLAGETYNEEIIGARDAGTRQLVATELLSALAARNVTRRDRAREVFIRHNYLDEATKNLRTAEAPAERAAAARTLGYVKERSTTPHLVAALEDEAPEVRRAAVEALAELRDPAAHEPLSQLLEREKDRKVPKNLIRRAIEASGAVEEETPTLEAEHSSADLAGLAVAGGALIASLPVDEEVETSEEQAAAQRAAQDEEARRREEEEARRRAEEERAREAAEEEARRQQAEEEARLQAEAEARRVAEEEEIARAEEERLRAEAEAKRLAEEEEARRQAEEEARLKAEEEARLAAEAEAEAQRQAEAEAARLRAEEEARLAAEAEAKRQAEEEAARLRAEEEARLAREEEERRQAEEAARLKAEEEERARLKAEEEERQRQAAEAKRLAEEEAARLKAEEEARLRAEEEERARQAEAERLRLEEEARQKAEEEARLAAEEAERKRVEEARLAAEAEAKRLAEEEAARLRAEEEARQRALEEARLKAEEEARLKAEEEARLAAEAEARRQAEEEATRLAEEERQRAEEEARRRAEELAAAEAAKAAPPVLESLVGQAGEPSHGWVDVDVSEAEAARYPTSQPFVEDTSVPELTPEAVIAEPQASKEIVPALSSVDEPVAAGKGGYAVSEKGLATLDEYSTVPGTILKRLSSEEPSERAAAVSDLARVGGDDSFREISAAFDDPAVEVRNAAARSLFSLNTDRAATFTRALREAPPERRRKIGSALASSGLASEAIGQLMGESREKTYDAFSLLFLMSKAGEVQPLMRAIEEHPNNEVRLAVVKLLALSGQQEILPAFRRLAVRGSLPTEVRSAVMEAIYQISSQSPTAA